ncbi:MAG: MipA/OmpV family protein [Hyphomicrobiaceae bacterium]|nr:MipA/OmpV family protein [Hyphomicrobiaceae bacterium]
MTRAVQAAGAAMAFVVGFIGTTAEASDDGRSWFASDGIGVQIGGMAVVSPRYEGSADYRVVGFPFAAPAFASSDGRFQFKGPDDIRLRLFDHSGFEAGPMAGWRFGRDEEDGTRLWGLGDVDGGLVVGGYMAYRLGILKPFLSYHHQVTGDDAGGVLRAGTEVTGHAAHGVRVTGTLGASYADDSYMNAYFSVTPAQAIASVAGLPVFDADAGVKDVFLGISAAIPLADAWTLRIGARYAHLVGDAADSPIVESESQITGSVALTYRLNLR